MRVMDEWATLKAVARNRLSMSRLGDAEIKLAADRGAMSQEHDPGLSKQMRRLLANPNPAVLVCIPRIWPEPPLASKGFWPQYYGMFAKYCRRDYEYGSSFVSRRDAWPIHDEDMYWSEWKKIWAARPALLVTGSKKGNGTRKLLRTAASVDVLDVPRQHAWSAYEAILADCRAWAAAKQDPIILAACGATATVLCHELGSGGVQALDMGHAAQAAARVSPKELDEI